MNKSQMPVNLQTDGNHIQSWTKLGIMWRYIWGLNLTASSRERTRWKETLLYQNQTSLKPVCSGALMSVRVIRPRLTTLCVVWFSVFMWLTWHTLSCGWALLCCVATCTEYTPLPLFTTISSFSYLLLPLLLLLFHHLLSRPPLSSPHSALSAIYSKLPTQPSLPATILPPPNPEPTTHYYPLLSTTTHYYPLLPTTIHYYPLLPTHYSSKHLLSSPFLKDFVEVKFCNIFVRFIFFHLCFFYLPIS